MKTITARIEKARRNLVLLDPEFIATAQDEIKRMEAERVQLAAEVQQRPPTEKDINHVVQETVHNLFSFASMLRRLAHVDEPGWVTHGTVESAAPKAVQRLLKQIEKIEIHTRKVGRGNGTRHQFLAGKIHFYRVGGATVSSNPHRSG